MRRLVTNYIGKKWTPRLASSHVTVGLIVNTSRTDLNLKSNKTSVIVSLAQNKRETVKNKTEIYSAQGT